MKFLSLIILALVSAAPAAARQTPPPRPAPAPRPAPTQGQRPAPAPRPAPEPGLERRADADPAVGVSVCLSSGVIVVRGWERREVSARAAGAGAITLETDGGQAPARRVQVLVGDEEGERPHTGACGVAGSLELSVPRGASVSVRVQDGDVVASDVAELRVNSLSGDVDARAIGRAADLATMSGDISLSDSKGRARLRAVSGSVEANNVEPLSDGDEFEATSTSGEVSLEGVTHAHVNGSAISGSVRVTGPLARGGEYEFKTISGDVTLALPAEASFRLNAKVVLSGEIVTDFPVRAASISPDGEGPPLPPAPPARGKPGRKVHVGSPQGTALVGTVGTGDAAVSLSSFSGTIHLKRQ